MKLLPVISTQPFSVYMERPQQAGQELLTIELAYLRNRIISFDYFYQFNHLYLHKV